MQNQVLKIDVKYLWNEVDKTEVLILHQFRNNYYPQIHIHNSNKLLNK